MWGVRRGWWGPPLLGKGRMYPELAACTGQGRFKVGPIGKDKADWEEKVREPHQRTGA